MLKSCIASLECDLDAIHSIGGSAKSDIWCRIKADVTQKKIITLKEREPACKGSAILAGLATGVYSSVGQACEKTLATDRVILPERDVYAGLYEEYMKINEKIYGGECK
jgi:xylulokinase